MPTASIPNRPSGGDARSIAQILANFDSLIGTINALDRVNMGTGFLKTKRVSATLAPGATGDFDVVWDTPFPDTNYTICGLAYVEHRGIGQIYSVIAKAADKITVHIVNTSVGLGTDDGVLEATAIHD